MGGGGHCGGAEGGQFGGLTDQLVTAGLHGLREHTVYSLISGFTTHVVYIYRRNVSISLYHSFSCSFIGYHVPQVQVHPSSKRGDTMVIMLVLSRSTFSHFLKQCCNCLEKNDKYKIWFVV